MLEQMASPHCSKAKGRAGLEPALSSDCLGCLCIGLPTQDDTRLASDRLQNGVRQATVEVGKAGDGAVEGLA